MPALAAIAPAPPPAVVAATTGASGKPAPFHLELGGTDQAAAPGQAAPLAAPPRSPKPPSAKPLQALAPTEAAPPAWLMAMLGGSPVPAPDGGLSILEVAGDDGMPAPPASTTDVAVAARPGAKAGCAAQPLPAAADPAASAVRPITTVAKDADVDGNEDLAATPLAPQAAVPLPHQAVTVHPAEAQAQPAIDQAPPQAVTDATANLQDFARSLDLARGDPSAPATAGPAPHAALNTAHAELPQALADQVQWQLGREVQEARLELHPRDLGAVQVQVRITGEGAEVRFAATHPQAREALEAALPQLRSLLQGDGIALAQTQVGTQSSWRQPAQPQQQAGQGAGAADTGEDAAVTAAPRVVRIGLVDDFA